MGEKTFFLILTVSMQRLISVYATSAFLECTISALFPNFLCYSQTKHEKSKSNCLPFNRIGKLGCYFWTENYSFV